MDALDKCKTRIRAAIDELEREGGHPVLGMQMVVLTAQANHTDIDDPDAQVRAIAVQLLVVGSFKRLPWLYERR